MFDKNASCRTCGKHKITLVNIYQSSIIVDDCSRTLAEVLSDCTSLKVCREDGLPQHLCEECGEILRSSYKFRQQAIKIDKELRELSQKFQVIKEELTDVETKPEISGEFKQLDDLLDTSISDSENNVDTCNKYEDYFSGEEKYLDRLTTHDALTNNKSRKQLISEIKLKQNLDYKCLLCDQLFETENSLLEHTLGHTDLEVKTEVEDQEVFPCPNCDIIYTKRRSLALHMKKHKSKNIVEYQCDFCNKSFTVKSRLRRHMKLHSDIKPYKCTKCPRIYSRKDQLINHMNKHGQPVKRNVCPHCNKAFAQMCTLKVHILTHTGETPFLCSECGRGFNNRSNLRQHMLRHTGAKPFACNLCPKTFCTKGQLTCHIGTHTGAHPYKCEDCGATFTKLTSLKKHKFIHLGVKPFECDACAMRFASRDHLKRHYRIHTGEKPYRCQYCDRAFAQSNDLVKHTRAHVGQNIYKCTVCDMSFRLQSELKLHYPTHYIDSKDPPLVPVAKDLTAPVLVLKPPTETLENNQDSVKENLGSRKITITLLPRDANDKNGLATDFTINISHNDS